MQGTLWCAGLIEPGPRACKDLSFMSLVQEQASLVGTGYSLAGTIEQSK